MVFRVLGPRAQQFVDHLSRYCGLTLVLANNTVTVSRDTLINPAESETLQNLVYEIIGSPNVVEIAAFGGRPAGMGFTLDRFFANPGFQRPRRSVYVADFDDMENLSPTMARGGMGHVLREYFGAARPPGQNPGLAFALYHVPAIRTEAEIVSDLTGRPIWTGNNRPWEQTVGNTMVRSYGPGLRFQLVFSPGGELTRIIAPPGI